ncbi:hypothetical protein [Streptomyces acidicola]|uniref:hypothetical protein n=1 Tax=Streptomyces acidicola TaxID=2596892 RepID=UPI00188351D6|nr:hypothetical protein [Streptomyces acidicola]
MNGAPAWLCTRPHRVRPPERSASTRNAPWVRGPWTEASGQRRDAEGKTRTTPPWLCTAMSRTD